MNEIRIDVLTVDVFEKKKNSDMYHIDIWIISMLWKYIDRTFCEQETRAEILS